MNKNNNIYNQNEVKNKLQNFQEGRDYFVTPTRETKIKDYTFFNNHLKSLFGGNNWIPVRVWQEKYDDKNFSYRGHFEEGKDHFYSAQYWDYRKGVEKDYQGTHYPRSLLNDLKNFRNIKVYGEEGKFEEGKLIKYWESKENWYKNELEEEKNGNVSHRPDWVSCPVCDKKFNKNVEVWGVQDKFGFQPTCCYEHAENTKGKEPYGRIIKSGSDEYFRKDLQQRGRMGRNERGNWTTDNNLDLVQENHELRQQLASVQAELAKVLAELKKLTGKSKELDKLEQQQIQNEKVMKEGSTTQIKEQVTKSQALVQEAAIMNTVAPVKNEPKNVMFPCVIVGSLLVASVGAVVVWRKKCSRK